jgi:hypothetical protein
MRGPSGASYCATRGPDCATRRLSRLARPDMAGLTGCLRAAPLAACTGEYHSTTPSSTPVSGQGVVVPVTPPKNPHRMITRGKTGFRVVPDCLVLTAVTSSPTPSPIPSSARAALADPH